MKHPFFSYRTAFILTGITLVFVVGAIAGTRFISSSNGSLFTNLKSAVVPDALAGFNSNGLNSDYNDNYLTWTHSNTLKADDTTAQTLRKLALAYNTTNYYTLTDINGDGLVDVLYHDMSTSPIKFGVYLNNGNLSFTWAYKCAATGTNPRNYYGDCAG